MLFAAPSSVSGTEQMSLKFHESHAPALGLKSRDMAANVYCMLTVSRALLLSILYVLVRLFLTTDLEIGMITISTLQNEDTKAQRSSET